MCEQVERGRSSFDADSGLPHATGQPAADAGARQAALYPLRARQRPGSAAAVRPAHRHPSNQSSASPRNRQSHGRR